MIRKLLIINYSLLVIFSGCSFKNSNQEEHFFPKSTSKDNLIFGTTTNKNLITVSGVLKNVRYLESKNKWVYKISNQKKDFVFISKHQIPYVNYDVEAKFDEKKLIIMKKLSSKLKKKHKFLIKTPLIEEIELY